MLTRVFFAIWYQSKIKGLNRKHDSLDDNQWESKIHNVQCKQETACFTFRAANFSTKTLFLLMIKIIIAYVCRWCIYHCFCAANMRNNLGDMSKFQAIIVISLVISISSHTLPWLLVIYFPVSHPTSNLRLRQPPRAWRAGWAEAAEAAEAAASATRSRAQAKSKSKKSSLPAGRRKVQVSTATTSARGDALVSGGGDSSAALQSQAADTQG